MGGKMQRGCKEVIDLSKEYVENGLYIYDFEEKKEGHQANNALMAQVYSQTFRSIGRIVSNSINSSKDSARSSIQPVSNHKNNIIPLIGGRGTGKSSTLESIIKYLSKEDANIKRRSERLFGNESNTVLSPVFAVLNCIDADRLLEKESIFENVIIRMYDLYIKKIESNRSLRHNRVLDYKQRTLASAFTYVLKGFYSRNNVGESVIRELTEANAKVNIKDDFEKLVKDFLDYMLEGEEKEKFLVIPIDDIDENVTCAYDLMEEIHQYFMIDKIIVLVTMDITQFSYICEKHFANVVPTQRMLIEEIKESDNSNVQYWKKYVSRITQNYVDKILPTEYRIHLPGIHNENRRVFLENFEVDKSILGHYGTRSIKWVILYKIFRRTGIICDGLGKKKHYYEPDTIRKVVSLIDYLNQMDIVMDTDHIDVGKDEPYTLLKIKDGSEDGVLKANLESIYKDVVERMEYEKLQPEKKETFDDIRRQHRSRQHKRAFTYFQEELINYLGKQINAEGLQLLPKSIKSVKSLDVFNAVVRLEYSYGDYQNILNEYSIYVDKKMIHMILALQTANMTSLYNDILLGEARYSFLNQKESDEAKKEIDEVEKRLKELFEDLRQITGGSLSGRWSRVMISNTYNRRFRTNLEKTIEEKLHSLESDLKKEQDAKQNKDPDTAQDKDIDDYIPFNSIDYLYLLINLSSTETTSNTMHIQEIAFNVPVSMDQPFTQDQIAMFIETIMVLLSDVDVEIVIKESEQQVDGNPDDSEDNPESPEPVQEAHEQSSGTKNDLMMTINIMGTINDYDVLGFVMWYFDSEKSKSRIDNNVSVMISDNVAKSLNWNLGNDKTYEDSIKQRLHNRFSKYYEATLPFYSQDVYYNLLKRLKENKGIHFDGIKYDFTDRYNNCIEIVNTLDVGDRISGHVVTAIPNLGLYHFLFYGSLYLKLLGRIEKLLEKEDFFYNGNKKDANYEKLIGLVENYLSCAFIQKLLRNTSDFESSEYSDLINLSLIGAVLAHGFDYLYRLV